MPPANTPVTTYILQYQVQGLSPFTQAVNQSIGTTNNLAKATRDLNTERDRLIARMGAVQARLSALTNQESNLTRSINDQKAALAKLQPEYDKQYTRLGNLYTRLGQAQKAGDTRQVNLLQGQIKKLLETYGELFLKVENFNKALGKESPLLARVSAEIGVKKARSKELGDQLSDLTDKEKAIAAAAQKQGQAQQQSGQQAAEGQRGFHESVARSVIEMERFTYQGAHVVRLLEAMYRGTTGKSLLGVFGTGGAGTATLVRFAAVAAGISVAILAVGLAFKGITSIIGVVTNGFKALIDGALNLAGQGFQAVIDGAQRVGQALLDLGKQALDIVADWERFNLSTKALIALSLVQEGRFSSVSAAMSVASMKAKALQDWMLKLAILSPFSLDDVRNATRYGQAMGFTTGQAMRLTRVLFDWASATGRTGEEIQRVILALGQMRSLGRLSGQDLMQLAQVGVNVDELLARWFNKSVQEVRKLRQDGLIPVQEAMTGIVAIMERDFAGAAAKQAHSLFGLINSLQDLGKVYMRDLFGPMDEANEKVGGILGVLRKHLDEFVTFLQRGDVLNSIKDFGRSLEQMAENAYQWGRNLIISFANGMMSAVQYIFNVLNSIADALTYWLEAHSPPRLLPDIDEWGMAAMTAYIEGFGLADLTTFSDMASQISSLIQSTIISEPGERLGLIERIFGTRDAIAAVIDQVMQAGQVTTDMLQNVYAQMGVTLPAAREYIRVSLELALQNRRVAEAQAYLNEVTKKYEELLKPIDKRLQDIDDAQQDYLDSVRKTHLELILKDPNATLAEKEMARLEIARMAAEKEKRILVREQKEKVDAAQTALDAEELRQQQLEEQQKLQEELLKQQIEVNRLLQDYLDLVKQLAKEREKAGGGGETPLDTGIFGFPEDKLRDPSERQKDKSRPTLHWFDKIIEAYNAFKEKIGTISEQVKEKLKPTLEAFDKFKLSLQNLINDILGIGDEKSKEGAGKRKGMAEIMGEMLAKVLDRVNYYAPLILNNLTLMADEIDRIWVEHGPEIEAGFGNTFLILTEIVLRTIFTITWWWTWLTYWIGFAWDIFAKVFTGDFGGAWDEWAAKVRLAGGVIYGHVKNFLDWIITKLAEKFAFITTFWTGVWNGLQTKAEEVSAQVYTVLTGKIQEILTYLKDPEVLNKFIQAGKDFVQGIIDGISLSANKLWEAVRNLVNGMFATATSEAESESPSKRASREIGKPIVQGAAIGMLQNLNSVRMASAAMIGAAITPPATSSQITNSSVTNTTTNQWILNANIARNSDSVTREFAVLRALA